MGVGPVTDCCGLKFHWEAAEIVSRSMVHRKSVTLDTFWSALSGPKGHKSQLSILFIDIDILGCFRSALFTCRNNSLTGFSERASRLIFTGFIVGEGRVSMRGSKQQEKLRPSQ